ncbi:MAG: cell wall-binding repeat-containing protein [Actinobacteria bacterium]|nr:cell wall-binding repeat-containing protein [Actinomycetota bacterium]
MRTSATARRWERGILALVLATAVALTAVAHTDAEAIDGPVDVVYIATGNNFADALVASVVAAMNGAPLLTVKSPGVFGDEIPQVTKDKLTELKPARIVVLGGPAAVSDKVFNELKVYSPDVTRVEGEDRFETAALIADLVPEAVKRAFFADKAGDADTLDGKDSTAFALSDKACPSGQVAKGTNEAGNPICTPDNTNGGDADTLDGLDSTAFAPTGHAHLDLFEIAHSTNGVVITGTAFTDVGTMSVEVTVPAGHQAILVARYTAESECRGAAETWCSVRIVVDGTEAHPQEGALAAFDSAAEDATAEDDFESHAIDRSSDLLGPGTYTVTVQARTFSNTDTLWLDDHHLTVEAKLVS